MTKEKYAILSARLDALELVIFGPVRMVRGGKYTAHLRPKKRRVTGRRRLDAL